MWGKESDREGLGKLVGGGLSAEVTSVKNEGMILVNIWAREF